ncbi:fungal-specific transcription factor domain-domain-containing protein [Protomyces lactucae-debilis]|uniref:Fungal-specific transcription factor domain-domain-containing protein n=1 Tax=Protomyces lactucae-debilis TaxID=2754530 RepID=A0A1Y2FFF3_PROLT|nr:fungal-specific transcription factor domain-containing protein [Protomyces lactucae-debilis]ORY82649.1 fungal-specific transcription factor domain-domain-containing protein [Protomyces lactucae-debilis]
MSQSNTFYANPSAALQMNDKKPIAPHKPKLVEGQVPQPKRRVKTGCLTCRKRRIKCIPAEDGSPDCNNCTKTKRVCIPAPPVVPASSGKRRPSTAKRSTSDQSVPRRENTSGPTQPAQSGYSHSFEQETLHRDLQTGVPSLANGNGYVLNQEMMQPRGSTMVELENYLLPLGGLQPTGDIGYPYLSPGLPPEVEITDSFPFTHTGPYGQDMVDYSGQRTASFSTHSASLSTPGPLMNSSLPTTMDGLNTFSAQEDFEVSDQPLEGGAPLIMDHAMQQHLLHQQIQAQQMQQQEDMLQHSQPQFPTSSYAPAMAPHISQSTSAKSSPQNMYTFLKDNTQYMDNEQTTALEWRSPPPAQLNPDQQYFLNQFIRNPPIAYGTLDERYIESPGQPPKLSIRESNFWSFVMPSMALRCPALLHALLALSEVREANMQSNSDCENRALLNYHQAVRKLGKAIKVPGSSSRDELLAATLVLAYYETTSGETMRWGRHLEGSVFLVKQRIASTYNINENAQFQFLKMPSTAEHLIWFHIHQDAVQSLLSGTGLYLDMQYILAMPLRGNPGSVMHSTDQLRVLMARVGDFVGRDRKRKEAQQNDPASLEQAFKDWNQLLGDFNSWKKALPTYFEARVIPGTYTPFGDVLVHQHPAIATIATMHLASLLCLHRYRPDLSLIPAEAGKATIMTTYPISQMILRMLSGIMVDALNNKEAEESSHVKAMINSTMPAFLAGTSLQDPDQRDYLDRMCKDIFSFTGWRTALRVCQGLDVAWGREARKFHGLVNTVDSDPTIVRETGSQAGSPGARGSFDGLPSGSQEIGVKVGGGAPESRFVLLDKSQALNAVVGVLGRLTLVKDESREQSSMSAFDTSPRDGPIAVGNNASHVHFSAYGP